MSESFRFKPYEPKVGSRIRVTRECKVCHERKDVSEMNYAGPITSMSRDPALFQCKSHENTNTN